MGDLSVSTGSTAFMCILYVALGIISVLCSILNLTIWFSSRELRRKCLYLLALDACEFINGISYILVGTGRGLGLIYGYLTEPITVRQCYFDLVDVQYTTPP
ncbi:hypothetical protein OESDEN_04524 [Oesophagostomum dentatum]|uniref:G-protein coupled receptors family 1 profile domain-containing protein n=1 Tax=Oesophagostomum dentatum TaxID=61180 RepID=A0A0B1TJD9_OESDE|nr:hypothetical protein OESDEN_04524 [Oesophagostomum dentatum]